MERLLSNKKFLLIAVIAAVLAEPLAEAAGEEAEA